MKYFQAHPFLWGGEKDFLVQEEERCWVGCEWNSPPEDNYFQFELNFTCEEDKRQLIVEKPSNLINCQAGSCSDKWSIFIWSRIPPPPCLKGTHCFQQLNDAKFKTPWLVKVKIPKYLLFQQCWYNSSDEVKDSLWRVTLNNSNCCYILLNLPRACTLS